LAPYVTGTLQFSLAIGANWCITRALAQLYACAKGPAPALDDIPAMAPHLTPIILKEGIRCR